MSVTWHQGGHTSFRPFSCPKLWHKHWSYGCLGVNTFPFMCIQSVLEHCPVVIKPLSCFCFSWFGVLVQSDWCFISLPVFVSFTCQFVIICSSCHICVPTCLIVCISLVIWLASSYFPCFCCLLVFSFSLLSLKLAFNVHSLLAWSPEFGSFLDKSEYLTFSLFSGMFLTWNVTQQ